MLLAVALYGQDAHDTHGPSTAAALLKPGAKVTISSARGRIYKNVRCDSAGNIFLQPFQAEGNLIPILRVDGKGATVKYSVESDPAFAGGYAYDFSVLPNGQMYQSVQVGQDVYLVSFARDGTIQWKSKLERSFLINRIVAFTEKLFLAIGTEIQPREVNGRRPPPKLFLAFFDDKGRMIRRASFTEASTADKSETAEPPIKPLLDSDGQASANGDVYAAIATTPALVYVFDSAGNLLRSFAVDPPVAEMSAVSMTVLNNHVAILFRLSFRGMSHGEYVIRVVDASTGQPVADYSVPRETGTALGCFRPDEFLFVGSDEKNLTIQHLRVQ